MPEALAPEGLEWVTVPKVFSFSDPFQHLAGLERFMYAANARGRPNRCSGHNADLASGLDGVRAYLDRCRGESLAIFGAMAERKAHHRRQLTLMASQRGRSVAPRFGLTEQELAAKSIREN